MNKKEITNKIKTTATALDFDLIGIVNPKINLENSNFLDIWLENGHHASMDWIKNRKEERKNIFKYFPEVKSIISFGHNYYSNHRNKEYKISNYSWGEDYHNVIKDKLFSIIKLIQKNYKDVNYRICVDTSPIMEKPWAQKAGLGWIGKHTNLINNTIGSWFFLSEILLDIELIYDDEFNEDLCGTCTKCIDSCPTNALDEYTIDSNKCISYLTIEHRGDIAKKYNNKLSDWIYGCDICQEVCPWNIKFEKVTNENKFHIRKEIKEMDKIDWENISREKYTSLFKKSAIKRTKFEGLVRNIKLNKK